MDELSQKIVVGLERISEAFKALIWEKAKKFSLSPIQIQILIFISNHKIELCNVSQLAKEFNVTKPTISDAIRVLDKKELVIKDHSSTDSRSYSLLLSEKGKDLIGELTAYTSPFQKEIGKLKEAEQAQLYSTLTQLIYQLNKTGVLTVQRTCYACRFYSKVNNVSHCNFLQKDLAEQEIRLDCAEFEGVG